MPPRDSSLSPDLKLRARGAASNRVGRYEAATREVLPDGWDAPAEERLLRTETRHEVPRSAISWNASPDLPFDRSVNPYRGCEHGCTYCFARPTHAYLNLSPGLDFETRLVARPGIGAVLAREIGARNYKVAPLALGTNTDPYQPIEAREQVMREVLQVLSDWNHPVAITTKGSLITRDLDLLAPMAAKGLVRVGISIATLDAALARSMEPRCPALARRLEIIRQLAAAGIEVRAMVAPVVPGLTDHELEPILTACRDAGAVAASYITLRLPLEVAQLFRDWLAEAQPGRAGKVMARLREMQGGRDYDPSFGRRMRGQGLWAELLRQRFEKACARLGLAIALPALSTALFAPPPRAGDQLSLF